jgi:hypothetical protein
MFPGPLLALLVGLAPGRQGADERPAFWQVLERALVRGGVEAPAGVVLAHLAGVPARHAVRYRLARVERALTEPWTPPELARELRELLAAPAERRTGARFDGLLEGAAVWLDLAPRADPALQELDELWAKVAEPALAGLPLLEALSAFVGRAHQALDEALSGLAPEDWPLLFEGHAGFAERWYRTHFAGAKLAPEDEQELARFRDHLLAVPRLDRARQLGVAARLLRLAEPAFLAGLPKRLADARGSPGDLSGEDDVLAVAGDEPWNRVVLYGRRGSAHAADVALALDLGGSDTWTRAAIVDDPARLVGIALDLAGDDEYACASRGPAYAAGGVALLVDARGKDRYRSGRLGQAASALGVALQIDLEGDDVYTLEDYGQGHALAGVALLYDLAGDDRYDAWAFAQGGGIGVGLCALVDGAGADAYLADRHWPDVYGDSGPDVYHGASQGYSTGLRPQVAGGIAALVDLGDGADRYQAGSFAQGGGYFFALGLMFDGGGDDENHATRYGQGFGVHQAVGVRWDAGGDDRYACRTVAHTGMAWDEGVGYLIDEAGDDVYETGSLACGGAAQTGIAVCLDLAGSDRYQTGGQSEGGTGGSEYHEKPALGFLLDLGSGNDAYSQPGRGAESVVTGENVGVFVDLPERDAERALRSRRLR